MNKEVSIQFDACSYTLGGVRLQEGKSIVYTSCALKDAEKNSVQIEKEMLAIVHSCTGSTNKPVKIETDHKLREGVFRPWLVFSRNRMYI